MRPARSPDSHAGAIPTGSRIDRRALAALLPLCLSVFLAAADQTVVVTVLPDLLADVRVSVSELDRASWTVTAYLIGYVAAMPLMGRLADRYGWHRVLVFALAVFGVGSVLVALSPEAPGWLGFDGNELGWAIGARALQAVGGSATIPIALTVAATLSTRRRQAVAFGVVGASAEAGSVIGPLWGGAIGTLLSWEWTFWLNVPIVVGLVAVLLTPPFRPIVATAGGRVDYVGAALIAGSLTMLVWALVDAAMPGASTIALLTGAIAAAAAAWAWGRRSGIEIIPGSLLRASAWRWAGASHVLIGSSLIVVMVSVPLMANTVLGASALDGGFMLLRFTVAVAAGALIGGLGSSLLGQRPFAFGGLLLAAAGLFLLSTWGSDIADPRLTFDLAVAGLGFGLLISPVVSSALRDVEEETRATAAAWITLARMLGMAIGLAAMTAWGTARFESIVADLPDGGFNLLTGTLSEEAGEAGVTVFRGFFRAGALIALTALAPAWLMTRQPGRGKP